MDPREQLDQAQVRCEVLVSIGSRRPTRDRRANLLVGRGGDELGRSRTPFWRACVRTGSSADRGTRARSLSSRTWRNGRDRVIAAIAAAVTTCAFARATPRVSEQARRARPRSSAPRRLRPSSTRLGSRRTWDSRSGCTSRGRARRRGLGRRTRTSTCRDRKGRAIARQGAPTAPRASRSRACACDRVVAPVDRGGPGSATVGPC